MNKNFINTIQNKKITIVGAGISGLGAAHLAQHLGASVTLTDINHKLKKQDLIRLKDINIILGKYPDIDKTFQSELVIVSPGIDCTKNKFIQKISHKKIPIISEIEFASWYTKSKIIAVTGTNGKSTVVKLVADMISTKYSNTMLGGNIGISFSMNVLDEIKNNKNDVIHVLEISSFQLEKIYLFKSSIACILNISPDHLNRYKDFEDYCNTKFKIYNKNLLFYNGNDNVLDKKFIKNKMCESFSNHSKIKIANNTIYDSKTNQKILNIKKTNLLAIGSCSTMTSLCAIFLLVLCGDSF